MFAAVVTFSNKKITNNCTLTMLNKLLFYEMKFHGTWWMANLMDQWNWISSLINSGSIIFFFFSWKNADRKGRLNYRYSFSLSLSCRSPTENLLYIILISSHTRLSALALSPSKPLIKCETNFFPLHPSIFSPPYNRHHHPTHASDIRMRCNFSLLHPHLTLSLLSAASFDVCR